MADEFPPIDPEAGPSSRIPDHLEAFDLTRFRRKRKEEILEYTQRLYDAYNRGITLPPPPHASDDASDYDVRPPARPSASDIRPPQPNTFTGTRDLVKVRNWLQEVEQYVEFYNLDKIRGGAVDTAVMWLSGDAKTWWYSVKATGAHPRTWADFTETLCAQYIPRNAEDNIRKEFATLRQTTSVSKYASEFRRILLLHPRLTQEQILFQFKLGLKEHIRVDVNIRRPTTLDEAEEIALELDSYHYPSTPSTPKANNPNPKQGNPAGQGRQDPRPGQPRPGNPNHQQRGQQPGGNQQQQQQINRLTPLEREYLQSVNGCFRCRQTTHSTRDCPTYRPPAQPQNPGPRNPNPHQPARQPIRVNNAEAQTDQQNANQQQNRGFPNRQ
jgi:Retrotransposon gag protein